MMKCVSILYLLVLTISCRKHYDAPVPDTKWSLFESPAATTLTDTTRKKLEGVYSITTGAETFGPLAALKWSYNANATDTTYYLSFFCEKEVAYFICEGKQLDSSILLNGYWRKMIGTATGKARFTITKANGAAYLLNDTSATITNAISISGTFGNGDNPPDQAIQLTYLRPLYKAKPLEIVVHRGGGQTADLLPASENSAQIIQLASRFGATGIEIDVRLTKDGIPVLFHDDALSERLIQKNGMVGPVEDYTYAQLNALVRLIRGGERIPTLEEAFQTMVYSTPLHYVWLDIKFHSSLQKIRDLQADYMQRAAAIGRNVEITIGIPDTIVLKNFLALPLYQTVPAVCELDPTYVEEANARIWGPRWTLGLQNEQVANIHAQGRRAFVWTLDIPQNIKEYMQSGHFDGILSNYPSAVAYYYYVQQ